MPHSLAHTGPLADLQASGFGRHMLAESIVLPAVVHASHVDLIEHEQLPGRPNSVRALE